MIDLTDFLTDSGHHSSTPAWWNFEFPCGLGANVWLSATPFRFDMEVDKPDDKARLFTGLTSEQVEERLRALEVLPADPDRAARVLDGIVRGAL